MKNYYKSPLLAPISVGNLKLKNRLVTLPMACCHGVGMSETSISYYERKAKGGFGLIIREGDGLDCGDDIFPGHKELCDRIHAAGSKIIGQLGHPGRQVPVPGIVAPSPIPCMMIDQIPDEITIEGIKQVEDAYAAKAEFCKRAGYDGVEIHAAHGYLLAEFMSTYANKRTDDYGGTLENRMRIIMETIKKVRKVVGFDYTVSFRISADEFVPGGRTIEETKAIAMMLEKAGIDMINVTSAVYGSEEHYMSPMSFPVAYLADLAKEVKSVVNIPVLACDRIRDPKIGESLIVSGKCDLVGMGRASVADPELPNKFFSDRYEEIRPCIGCNQGCLHSLNTWQPVTCLVNPEIGREYLHEFKITKKPRKVTVIGAGPAGMEAAITAAKAGHRVTIYDKNHYVGGNFYIAAFPPTKGTIAEFNGWAHAEMKRLGVTIELNTEYTVEMFNEENPEHVIIATGSQPIVPNIKGIGGSNVVTAEDILLGKVQAGRTAVVCGGGLVGAETANFLAMNKRLDFNNRKVTVVEMRSVIAPEEEYTRKLGLLKLMDDLKVTTMTDTKVVEIMEDGVLVETDGESKKLPCETIVLAFGYKAETTLYNAIKDKVSIQIIGDANGVSNALKAAKDGFIAGCNIE